MTLLILAAGMGSRYGGLKQIDPIGKNGEFIIDYSVYDAIKAGFNKVVFVIKKENYESFKDTIGKRFEGKVNVEYAFQSLDDLPDGFSLPENREKPWGTAHAVLAARNVINEPFAVINADDFYGYDCFLKLAEHLKRSNISSVPNYCLVGYMLKNTLTEHGSVSRGVCEVNDGKLSSIVERTKIYSSSKGAYYEACNERVYLPENTVVSMNSWGFMPDIFERIMTYFKIFLKDRITEEKSEYFLPTAVEDLMKDGLCEVSVYSTTGQWYGVTYKEDKEYVKDGINQLIKEGVYPLKLS